MLSRIATLKTKYNKEKKIKSCQTIQNETMKKLKQQNKLCQTIKPKLTKQNHDNYVKASLTTPSLNKTKPNQIKPYTVLN